MTDAHLTEPPTDDSPTNQLNGAAALERYKALLSARGDDAESVAKEKYENQYRERWWAVDDQFYSQIFANLTGSVERSRASAETVQKASAAIATLYGAGIGVSFSVSDGPMPLRGVIPLVFLGLAVVCSTAYLAWIPDARSYIDSRRPEAESLPVLRQRAYADEYTTFVWRQVTRQAPILRASLVALALGLAFIPAPFLEISTEAAPHADAVVSTTVAEADAAVSTTVAQADAADSANVPGADAAVSADAELPPWPGQELVDGLDPDVAAALMEVVAQETADLRSKQRSAASGPEPSIRIESLPEWGWFWLTLIGIGAVALTALIRRRPPAEAGSGA